jgi:hypothetical protein
MSTEQNPDEPLDWKPGRRLGGPIFLALGFVAAALAERA